MKKTGHRSEAAFSDVSPNSMKNSGCVLHTQGFPFPNLGEMSKSGKLYSAMMLARLIPGGVTCPCGQLLTCARCQILAIEHQNTPYHLIPESESLCRLLLYSPEGTWMLGLASKILWKLKNSTLLGLLPCTTPSFFHAMACSQFPNLMGILLFSPSSCTWEGVAE